MLKRKHALSSFQTDLKLEDPLAYIKSPELGFCSDQLLAIQACLVIYSFACAIAYAVLPEKVHLQDRPMVATSMRCDRNPNPGHLSNKHLWLASLGICDSQPVRT